MDVYLKAVAAPRTGEFEIGGATASSPSRTRLMIG
jgi:hypothetical protein